MSSALESPQVRSDDSSNVLQTPIHTFVFGGEEPSEETEDRAKFVESFLAGYYKTAQQGALSSPGSNETASACSCATCTTTCAVHGQCNTSNSEPVACSAEFASEFNCNNSADEAERHNIFRDMTAKLSERINNICKGNNNSTKAKKMKDMPQHLQFFVDNVNESLQMLGTTDLTEEELKLLLAAAPLPNMTNDGSAPQKNDVTSGRQRSNSAKALGGNSMITPTRPRSVSAAADMSYSPKIHEEQGTEEEQGDETVEGGKTRKKRLSAYFSKKMESFTNLLDQIEHADWEEQQKSAGNSNSNSNSKPDRSDRAVSKSKSFNFGANKGSNTTPSTPKTGNSGCTTPTKSRSGYTTPQGDNHPLPDLDAASLRLKLELVEKALCDEVVVRTEAVKKITQLEDVIVGLKTNLDRANGQNDTVNAINKQLSVEVRFLRQRNSRAAADRKEWEDALVGETDKRRALENQMQMLIKTFKQHTAHQNVVEELLLNSETVTHEQQETIFTRQREEVLLGVIESLRTQLDTADTDMKKFQNEWQEERAKYQESYDLLRFQLDQHTRARKSSLPGDEKGEEFNAKVDDVVNRRKLGHTTSVHDFYDKDGQPEASPKLESVSATPSCKGKPVKERVKLSFLSPAWWPKFDSLFTKNDSPQQPVRPPVLLLQIAWWVEEMREHVANKPIKFSLHSNQFCNCDDCVKNFKI